MSVCDHLFQVDTNSFSIYTDGSLRNLDTVGCWASAAVFFENINSDLGIGVLGLILSTLAEMQAIALALECVLLASSIHLFLDSQSALDAYKSKLVLACFDFHNQCWIKHYHIVNIICSKNLRVSWHKIKDHSGIPENNHVNLLTGDVSIFEWFFPSRLDEHFLVVNSVIVSGNSRHFVCNVYQSVCCAHWEIGSSSKFLSHSLLSEIDWHWSLLMWHPNLHMTTDYTSKALANMHTYFMKALHCRLPVAVHKCLYDKCYLSILCLYCGKVEVSDYVFFCKVDKLTWHQILESHVNS
ncbi:hypothetical protein G9A89_010899 [Geosiphon pyriformis]|nr:hypothetical protein G9A89_010899 [Geosiphon pyriformis]